MEHKEESKLYVNGVMIRKGRYVWDLMVCAQKMGVENFEIKNPEGKTMTGREIEAQLAVENYL